MCGIVGILAQDHDVGYDLCQALAFGFVEWL